MDRPFKILGKAPASIDPGKGALDDPSSGMDDEPCLIGELADDLDGYGGGISDALAVVGTVSEGVFDKRMPPSRLFEQRHRAITILHVSRMDEKCERTSVGIDHGMALAPHHLLAGIVAT